MTTLPIDRKNMVSVTELSRKAGKFVKTAKESPVYIMRNNAIESVLLDIERYEALLETIRVQEEALEYAAISKTVSRRKEAFTIEDALDEEDIMELL